MRPLARHYLSLSGRFFKVHLQIDEEKSISNEIQREECRQGWNTQDIERGSVLDSLCLSCGPRRGMAYDSGRLHNNVSTIRTRGCCVHPVVLITRCRNISKRTHRTHHDHGWQTQVGYKSAKVRRIMVQPEMQASLLRSPELPGRIGNRHLLPFSMPLSIISRST